MEGRIKTKAEEDLEAVVGATSPKTSIAVVLQSSAWHNKSNHKRHCDNPELVAVQTRVEEEQRFSQALPSQAEPTLQTLAAEEEQKTPEEETANALEAHKAGAHQQAATFGRGGGKDSYMPAETFQAGCTCGAEISVGGHDQMHEGDANRGADYSTNMGSDSEDTKSYLTNNSSVDDGQSKMERGSLVEYDTHGKKQDNQAYMP